MSVPKYKLVVNAKDGENGIEITEGKYEESYIPMVKFNFYQ